MKRRPVAKFFTSLSRALDAGRLKRRQVVALERIADALDRAHPKPQVRKGPLTLSITKTNLADVAVRQRLRSEAERMGLDPVEVEKRIDAAYENKHATR